MPIYLGNPCGVIVKAAGEPTVYHMGDTDIFSDMGLIAEIHQPKVAMVPICDRFTMSPKTAALAVKRFFKLDKVIPCLRLVPDHRARRRSLPCRDARSRDAGHCAREGQAGDGLGRPPFAL